MVQESWALERQLGAANFVFPALLVVDVAFHGPGSPRFGFGCGICDSRWNYHEVTLNWWFGFGYEALVLLES